MSFYRDGFYLSEMRIFFKDKLLKTVLTLSSELQKIHNGCLNDSLDAFNQ